MDTDSEALVGSSSPYLVPLWFGHHLDGHFFGMEMFRYV